jgi:hypothetical protein
MKEYQCIGRMILYRFSKTPPGFPPIMPVMTGRVIEYRRKALNAPGNGALHVDILDYMSPVQIVYTEQDWWEFA